MTETRIYFSWQPSVSILYDSEEIFQPVSVFSRVNASTPQCENLSFIQRLYEPHTMAIRLCTITSTPPLIKRSRTTRSLSALKLSGDRLPVLVFVSFS